MGDGGHYEIAFFAKDMKLMEKWYVKCYGLSEEKIPDDEKNLYEKIIVLRRNEEYLESLEGFEEKV